MVWAGATRRGGIAEWGWGGVVEASTTRWEGASPCEVGRFGLGEKPLLLAKRDVCGLPLIPANIPTPFPSPR
eukprot:scaffold10996_cov90-Isochrysis_galbana.AAC.6